MTTNAKGLSTRYSPSSVIESARMAVLATDDAPPITDGRKPAPTAAPVRPSVGSHDQTPDGCVTGGDIGVLG